MSEAERKAMAERQMKQPYHNANLSQVDEPNGDTANILRALSEVDDLPINPEDDPVMGQLVSKLSSTANLTEEQVRSNEWWREIIYTLYLTLKPREEGAHGSWREWMHNDANANIEPMTTRERLEWETFIGMSKLTVSRSEGAKVMEEAVRTVSESIVNDGEGGGGSSGGLLGRLGLR